jgi:hypothetical protein
MQIKESGDRWAPSCRYLKKKGSGRFPGRNQEGRSMLSIEPVEVPRAAYETRNVRDIKKMIVKLRWIGMDEEAVLMSAELLRISPAECPQPGPLDTD